MYESLSITDKKPEVKSRNAVPQIRRKTESFQSMNSPVDRILLLQRTIGNQAVGRLLKSGALQAKLRIGQSGDVYEQEADRVAEQVMRMSDMSRQAKYPRIQRKCPKCLRGLLGRDKKNEKLQAKEIHGGTPEVTSNMETNINALKGEGQPLPESTRAFFEPRFDHDFSQVRVHTDAKAAESARGVNAQAFTMGRDVVFGAGEYAPQSNAGQRLMAHELTHVVQQSQSEGTTSATLEIASSVSSEESEAAHNELAIQKSTRAVGIALQRHDDPNQYLGGTNMVFDNQGEARMAALAEATALGQSHTITHDPMPTRGLPHYHVVDPAGDRVRGHFFYRTRRRRRSYKVDWSAVRRVVITLGLSLAMIAVIIAALADPEPASKLALAGLSAAMIVIVLGRLSEENSA